METRRRGFTGGSTLCRPVRPHVCFSVFKSLCPSCGAGLKQRIQLLSEILLTNIQIDLLKMSEKSPIKSDFQNKILPCCKSTKLTSTCISKLGIHLPTKFKSSCLLSCTMPWLEVASQQEGSCFVPSVCMAVSGSLSLPPTVQRL